VVVTEEVGVSEVGGAVVVVADDVVSVVGGAVVVSVAVWAKAAGAAAKVTSAPAETMSATRLSVLPTRDSQRR
jgi:hypothetical protein